MGQGTGSHLVAAFPGLAATRFRITSPRTDGYNCIAWAVGDTERWWWPKSQYYWPPEIRRDDSVDAFVQAYSTEGFSRCRGGDFEDGFTKIAIYVGADARVKHAARLVSEGKWTSKLGRLEDIEHELDGVAGAQYGQPTTFVRRSDK